ncbi:alpha/beta hydrolase [uncultured Acinetobacter sp.]|uniref:alpha/beta hydrolase n=1 Tax=uncultured Acinetobacter sp. TaxID=165433 RepID=UPI0025DE3F74|nr:alpha/beta hydrolase [uncultured Acinetobacter sp.]
MNSADKVADRLNNQVMAQVKKEFPTATFKKFIVVTHSMGGLVAHALIQNAKVKDKIAGVVHGVCLPAVYQRLTVGWDGWKASTGLMNSVKAWATKFMFGDTSERLTAVLASASGALELLPFANYSNAADFPKTPKARLILKANTPAGEIIESLPKMNDPYNEIYKRKDCWWAMINPDFIDPAGIIADQVKKEKLGGIFDVHINNIVTARKLHDHIKDCYYSNSYAHYGADQEHKAFGQVVWRCKEMLNISSESELIELMALHRII